MAITKSLSSLVNESTTVANLMDMNPENFKGALKSIMSAYNKSHDIKGTRKMNCYAEVLKTAKQEIRRAQSYDEHLDFLSAVRRTVGLKKDNLEKYGYTHHKFMLEFGNRILQIMSSAVFLGDCHTYQVTPLSAAFYAVYTGRVKVEGSSKEEVVAERMREKGLRGFDFKTLNDDSLYINHLNNLVYYIKQCDTAMLLEEDTRNKLFELLEIENDSEASTVE